MKLLIQLCQQYTVTEVKAETEAETYDEIKAFIQETYKNYPLPENSKWLIVLDEKKDS